MNCHFQHAVHGLCYQLDYSLILLNHDKYSMLYLWHTQNEQ